MLVLEFVLLTDRLHRHCSRPQESTEQHPPPPRRPQLPAPSADGSIDTQQTRPRPRIH
jgi:hypothetical protein